MNVTSEQILKILTNDYTFSQLGFSMLITRLKKTYSKDQSPKTLTTCTEEINVFLEKYAPSMAADFAIISKL